MILQAFIVLIINSHAQILSREVEVYWKKYIIPAKLRLHSLCLGLHEWKLGPADDLNHKIIFTGINIP